MALLEVTNLRKEFGGVIANDNVSLRVEKGEIIGLIGPNGAGKTTLFNCIVGYLKPDKGRVRFKDEDITALKPFQTNRKGIARTFQLMKVIADLTVLGNVMVGSFCRTDNRRIARDKSLEVLEFLELQEYSNAYPTELPIATQKMIELARALATKPELLMLDEMAAGLNPKETEKMVALIRRIHSEKEITLFLIEHIMEVVMSISERIIVLDGGKKIVEGPPKEVAEDKRVIKAYLGERYVKG
ncbi:ABC transporter ATP-binding protein [Candidatus Aerophobetes bacterium]|nr:ABC transporter ATP-binding protein [Candidatus Aerophobetes bacterium]